MGAMVACAVLLMLPASALAAATYTWSQPSDVTTTGKYGVQSWAYSASGATLARTTSFTGNGATLNGYANTARTTWIATPASGSPAVLEMVPAQGHSVTITWTSPFSTPVQVNVSGGVNMPNSGLLCSTTTWGLTNDGTAVAGASGTGNAAISPSPVTVQPGKSLAFTVSDASLLGYSTSCDETDVALGLSTPATAPTVSVSSPTSGQTFTNTSLPTFSGSASDGFGFSPSVKVRVYSGFSASGTPVQTLSATESGGSWSVPAASGFPNNPYTVQAEQDDLAGDVSLSTPITFSISNSSPPPTVTINSLGSTPVTTTTPTISGTAGTASGDSGVQVRIFSGSSTSGSSVEILNTSVDGSGNWSVQVSPPLANGTYTAVAGQAGPGDQIGLSSPMTFTIAAVIPTGQLTLVDPLAGASVPQAGVLFDGSAATGSGDSSTVTVKLWKGGSASGTPFGTATATQSNGAWRLTWPKPLALGYYTAEASQVTASGTATAGPHTFLVVPTVGVIGNTVTLGRSRVASISVTCKAPSGQVCTGTVLVVTAKTYVPTPGGPKGAIKLIFAYVTIPAGETQVIRRSVSAHVWRTLRHRSHVKLKVTALNVSASRTLKIR